MHGVRIVEIVAGFDCGEDTDGSDAAEGHLALEVWVPCAPQSSS